MDADGSIGNERCWLKVFWMCAAYFSHLDPNTHL